MLIHESEVYSAESLWIIGWFTPNSSGKKSAMACHFPTYKIHHVVRGFPSLPHVDDNGGRAMDMNMTGCEYGYERAA